jgi:hypothetical protein
VVLLGLILTLTACHSGDTGGHASETSLKLYVFNCGMIRLETLEPFSIDDDETDIREVSVPCYIIEHEKGRLLWDGGLASSKRGLAG